MKVLIIEDDTNIVEFLCTAFGIGWPEARVTTAKDGESAMKYMERESPDIVLLDLGLPDVNGFDILKQIRLFSTVPIVIVSVRGEENFVVRGFALGADDYVSKPLRPLELIARMKALIKKRSPDEDLNVRCGVLHFGDSFREFYVDDKKIDLTNTEGRLVGALMKNAGKTVPYSQIARSVWGDDYPGAANNMKSHICHLRQKIEKDPSHPRLILNQNGVGYLLALR